MAPIQDIKSAEVAAAEVKAKADAEAKAKADADAAAKAKADAAAASGEKVGDLLTKKEEKVVPESAFLELKKENKAVWTELKKVQEMIASGLTKKEVSDTLKKIGEKYKVDPNFLDEVSNAIKAEADADADRKIEAKVKPLEEKEKSHNTSGEAERIDKIFKEHYAKTLEQMPEYKDIADADVIKSLTLDPANANKTFAQILEKAYGHLLKGKGKTLDTANPGGNKEPTEIDYKKASNDPEYFRSVMADPALRKEYNANLHKRLKL